MADYASNNQLNFKVGVSSFSENVTSLQVIGRTGIGSTSFDADYDLDVRGNANFTGIVSAVSFYGSGQNLTDLIEGKITGLTVQEEGGTVGTAGSVGLINFVGPNVTATASGTGATITISSAISYVDNAGIATNVIGGIASVTQLSVSGVSTLGIVTLGNIYSTGIITAINFVGDLTGNATSATYSTSAGIASYSTLSGLATYADNAGIATNIKGGDTGDIPYQSSTNTTTFVDGSLASSGQVLIWNGSIPSWGNVSAASGAFGGISVQDEGTPVGTAGSIVTVNFVGDNVNVTATSGANGIATVTVSDPTTVNYASTAGIATYATNAGIATYATNAGIATYATNAGIATYATTAGIATYATNAGIATYSSTAGIATTATNIDINATSSTDTTTYVVLVGNDATGGQQPFIDSGSLIYNASTNVLSASGFSGDGSSLTSLNADNISSGTLSDARLPDIITSNINVSSGISTISSVIVGSAVTINSSGISVTGIVTATDFNSTSDIKLKTNIQSIANSLEKVTQIQGVSFNWIADNRPSMGVIANELQKVLPELVSDSDPKTVNYNGIIALLIEAVKDLSNQVNELKSTNNKNP